MTCRDWDYSHELELFRGSVIESSVAYLTSFLLLVNVSLFHRKTHQDDEIAFDYSRAYLDLFTYVTIRINDSTWKFYQHQTPPPPSSFPLCLNQVWLKCVTPSVCSFLQPCSTEFPDHHYNSRAELKSDSTQIFISFVFLFITLDALIHRFLRLIFLLLVVCIVNKSDNPRDFSASVIQRKSRDLCNLLCTRTWFFFLGGEILTESQCSRVPTYSYQADKNVSIGQERKWIISVQGFVSVGTFGETNVITR